MSTKYHLARSIDAALKIAEKRGALLEKIRQAHQKGDRDAVFHLAGRLAGIPPPEYIDPQAEDETPDLP